jgi:hypothetical protein
MKNFKTIVAILLVNLFLVSCNTERSRQDKVSKMISSIDSPFLIATLTPQNLIDKSSVENGVLSFAEQTLVSFFIASENTGFDNNEQIQIIAAKGSGMTPDVYSIFKLNNADKYESLIKNELNSEVKEKDGVKYFIYDNYYVLAWQGEFGVGCNTTIDFKSMFSGKGGSNTKTINKCIALLKSANEGELNTEYNDFLSKDNDISTYFNAKNTFAYLKSMNTSMSGLNVEDIQKYEEKYGSLTHESALNFEKGKITFDQDFVLTDLLKEEFGFIKDKGIDSDLFKYGKSKTPMVSYSINVNSNQALDYLKSEMNERELDQMTHELNKTGLTIDELAESFSGQVLIMVDGVTTKVELVDFGYGEQFETKTNEPIMGAVFGIKDKSMFSKLPKDVTVSQNGLMSFEDDIFGCLTDEVFFVSNDKNWVIKVMNGESVAVDEREELTDNPYGFYAVNDLEKNKQLLEGDMKFASLFAKAYGFANLDNSKFTIELKNKSDNALKVISKFLSELDYNNESNDNLDMVEMLDDEILEDMENAMEDVEKALENVDVNALMNDVLKEVNK